MNDIIDVFRKLKKDFPHLQFLIKPEKNTFRGTYVRLYLVAINGVSLQVFDEPIKTSIVLIDDQYITDQEYYLIYNKVFESFNTHKLLGLS